MKLTVSDWNTKIFSAEDCVPLPSPNCLMDETFAFQLFAEADGDISSEIKVKSNFPYAVYLVKKRKGDFYLDKETDGYYVYAKDDLYPDLLTKTDVLSLKKGESASLFFEFPSLKPSGEHEIEVSLGGESVRLTLKVLPRKLCDTDLLLSHWFHYDCLCNYYEVEPFSDAFYARFLPFLNAYTKMGNNMLLVPVFTPPLDTAIGGERRTVQLVGAEKSGENYSFDFSKFDKFIGICKEAGIEYFELSHLFTQWGGRACPKVIVRENGISKKMFGWEMSSSDEAYLSFLKQYFAALASRLKELGIFGATYMHLTDEPNEPDLENYIRLAEFVRRNNSGIATIDAMSHYEIVGKGMVTLPIVSMNSKDFELFSRSERMLYYCINVDENFLTNRYFHMPLQRTEVLGLQLYETGAKGFLQWGFDFYNSAFSLRALDPYEETTADEHFCAGDAFLVYPGEDGPEYSLRYFAMLKAFEEYRLLKTVEQEYGREFVSEKLHSYGVRGVHTYPRDARLHGNFLSEMRALLNP